MSKRFETRGKSGAAPRGERGVALIAVLWVVMLLAVIAGSLMMLARTELGLSRNLVQSAKARALAGGGVHLAILGLLDTDPETQWKADSRTYRVELEAGVLEITIQDSGGLIDLNAAAPELLAGLFRAAGLDEVEAEVLADRVTDWRDPNNEPRPNGAEQADYDAAGYDLRVGNERYLIKDEIQRIPGVTLELYGRIAPAITVFARRPGVNPLTAPRLALLAAPGVDEETADAIVAARSEDGVAADLSDLAGLIPSEARRYFKGSASNLYVISSRASLPDGGIYALEAVIELKPNADPPWRVHVWRPGPVFAGNEDSNS